MDRQDTQDKRLFDRSALDAGAADPPERRPQVIIFDR